MRSTNESMRSTNESMRSTNESMRSTNESMRVSENCGDWNDIMRKSALGGVAEVVAWLACVCQSVVFLKLRIMVSLKIGYLYYFFDV